MARKRRKHNSESPPSKKSRPFQADLNADFIPLQNESEILQDKKKKAETETMQYIKKMAPALNKDGEEAIIAARAVLGGLGKLTIEMCFHEPANRVMIVAIKVADYSTVCDFLDAIFNGIYDLSELKGGCLIIETALKRLVDVLPQFEDHHRIQMWMDSFIEVVNSNPGDFLGGASFKARLITAFAECATGSILTAKPIEAANRPGFLVSLTEKLARSLAEVGSLFVLISDCDSASLAIQSLLWALQSMQLNDAFDAVVTPLIKPSEDCDVTRIVNMCTSSISSHVLERILTSPSWYEVIWKLIRNQLEEICVSSNGSFVIQRFLTFADSTSKVRKILKRLSPLMEAILDKGKHGIIVKIAEVGLIHAEIDDDLWKFIRDALHINEDTSAEDSIGALCSLNPLKNKTHGITVVTYHGSVLIQTLLKCTKVVFEIMDSLFKVPPKKLIFIMSDKFGCYIFESVFASRVITVKNKLHLTELLKNNYLDLACSQHGSFVFEKIWSFLKMEKRISVASELAGDVDRLCGDKFGYIIYHKTKLRLFSSRLEDWKSLQAVDVKKCTVNYSKHSKTKKKKKRKNHCNKKF